MAPAGRPALAGREVVGQLRRAFAGWQRPSVITLIAANLFPLFGALFLGWGVFPIMFLFWLENVVIGAFNVLRMLVASPSAPSKWMFKVIGVPFFVVHYGMFTLGHGVFVLELFGGDLMGNSKGWPLTLERILGGLSAHHLWVALLALVASHGFSFAWNYIRKGEYRHASPEALMVRPYGRVVLLHVTIIFGALLIALFGTPVVALMLLVVLKVAIDVLAHLYEHRKMGAISPNGEPKDKSAGEVPPP